MAAMPRSLEVRAYAKINLGLRILGRRPDGFHELRTVFQTISLADRLTVTLQPGRGVDLELAGDDGGAGPQANLAARAAALAAEKFKLRGRIRLCLEKRIPVGAGLGGGSSDAAAVLRALARWATPPPDVADLLPLAAELGSDVPAFLFGGTVLGLGRGEHVFPLPDLGGWHGILALPPAGPWSAVSTVTAFQAWDRRHPRRRPTDSGLPLENDFEPALRSLSPAFADLRRALKASGARWVGLTGSGAAFYGLFAAAPPARAALARLRDRGQVWPFRFVGRAAYRGNLDR